MKRNPKKRKSAVGLSFILCGAIIVTGFLLITYRPNFLGAEYIAVGVALLAGGIVALAIFLGEFHSNAVLTRNTERQTFLTMLNSTQVLAHRDLRDQDLRIIDFQLKDLQYVNFSGCDLREVNFSGANLRGAIFGGANLQRAVFDSADLRMANFSGSWMKYVDLRRVDARGASFQGALMDGTQGPQGNFSALTHEELEELMPERQLYYYQRQPSEFTDVSWSAMSVSAKEEFPEQLKYHVVKVTNFSKVLGRHSNWSGADFTDADLSEADFRWSSFGAKKATDPMDEMGFFERIYSGLKRDPRVNSGFYMKLFVGPQIAILTRTTLNDTKFEGSSLESVLISQKQIKNASFVDCSDWKSTNPDHLDSSS